MPDNRDPRMHDWIVRLKGQPPEPITFQAAYYRNGEFGLLEFKDTEGKIVYTTSAESVLDVTRGSQVDGDVAPREVSR